ncbi:MAG: FecR family protein, partial [Burkholderiales bacterium]|nr:FecR family protein [Burkholderiales bacterium]
MLPRLLFSVLMLAAASAASAQEVAGRVLVAVGDVTIQRGADKLRAARGTEVRTGDTVLLGERSNAQLRLTDESIIALSSNTTFRLTEYAFQKREPEQRRAFFDLLRGGLRTLTGLIGRSRRDNYAVGTPTATIGIRGTHYALRYCNNDCYEGGSASAGSEPVKVAAAGGAQIGPIAQAGGAGGTGTLAPNGTYGAVTDGRIGVTNQSGETVFGSDQYFFVATQATAPQQLIAPPPFLRDTLEGRAAAQKPAAGAPGEGTTTSDGGESASTVAQTGPGGGTGDVGVSGATTTSTVPPQLQINPFVVTEAAVAGGGIGAVASVPGEGILIFRTTGGVLSGVCTSGPPCELGVAEIRFGINLATQSVQGRINVIDLEDGGVFNLSTTLDFSLPVVNNNGVLSFSGTLTPSTGGVLRCESCNDGEVGQLQSLSLSGTVSGGNLNLTFTGVPPDGDAGTFSAVLPQVAAPSTPVAAVAYPALESTNP